MDGGRDRGGGAAGIEGRVEVEIEVEVAVEVKVAVEDEVAVEVEVEVDALEGGTIEERQEEGRKKEGEGTADVSLDLLEENENLIKEREILKHECEKHTEEQARLRDCLTSCKSECAKELANLRQEHLQKVESLEQDFLTRERDYDMQIEQLGCQKEENDMLKHMLRNAEKSLSTFDALQKQVLLDCFA